ncbi:MAG: serine acetyltransferase [Bacteroidota bacterium]
MTIRQAEDHHAYTMKKDYIRRLYQFHRESTRIPSPAEICQVIEGLLKLLFPELSDRSYDSFRDFEFHYTEVRHQLFMVLEKVEGGLPGSPQMIEIAFMDRLPDVKDMLMKDAQAMCDGDPAANSLTEVIRSYPGFLALAIFRLAHEFYILNVPLIPRILTEYAHSKTGIDIHPAARIGAYFCMDHGTGIVIGETVEIGDHVKLYQGVTLGAMSVRKELAKTKRHPTIQDRVIIYAGSTILGGETVIGHDSIIGGNVWLTKSIPPYSRIYYSAEGLQTEREAPPQSSSDE